MGLWVIVTLAAAAVRTVRFALQKRLQNIGLSIAGATFPRLLRAVPMTWLQQAR